MKIMTCFIDTSAWLAIINKNNTNHGEARNYFEQLLEKNTKIVTNNIAVDETTNILKKELGIDTAREFIKVIEDSILTINLRMDWISRRVRKNGLNQFLKSKEQNLDLKHFLVYETIKRKRVDLIFTFDQKYKVFSLPLMPHSN